MARPFKEIKLQEAEREKLEAWARAGNTPQKLVDRAQIILLSDDGLTAAQVVEKTGFSERTVYKWKGRFERQRIAGLKDLPRPGQPKKLTPEKAKQILKMTVEQIPHESTHWSQRLMAKYAGVSKYHVQKVWEAADLKPHRLRTIQDQ